MGVEPTTYTMRTYRSSQLSYCPTKRYLIIYPSSGKKQARNRFFSENKSRSGEGDKLSPPGKVHCQGIGVRRGVRRRIALIRVLQQTFGSEKGPLSGCLGCADAVNFFSTFFVFELDFSGIGGKLNSIVLQMGY